MAKRIVHYVNQFFAGIGGEEQAHIKPELREGPVGPGMAIGNGVEGAEIVSTVICGDSYFNENLDEAMAEILSMIKSCNPDIFVAGPAFNAGRYGIACATVAAKVQKELNIPVITGMYEENPGVDMFRKEVRILSTGDNAGTMRKAVPMFVGYITKIINGEEIGSPSEEGYFEQGARINYFTEKRGSARAVEMLINKLNSQPFETEYAMPVFDKVEPGKAIKDMKNARIAIVTSGGIVPSGNPDRIESSSASKYGTYELAARGETAHGGYDPVYANQNPDRVVAIDVLEDMVKEGIIGSLHPYYYSTTGNGTAVKSAVAYATEIAEKLLADKVDAVILTST